MPLNYHDNGIFVKIKYGSGCEVVSPKALRDAGLIVHDADGSIPLDTAS
jgi:hypothetical protein